MVLGTKRAQQPSLGVAQIVRTRQRSGRRSQGARDGVAVDDAADRDALKCLALWHDSRERGLLPRAL